MKPNFALNLTDDRISLLHRTGQGWTDLGTAIFGAEDMDAQLAMLHETATTLAPRSISTKLVIPNSQILYATLRVSGDTDAARRDEIRAGLAGRTPYPVEDLAFDYAGDGPDVQVAVVAQETLDQAEEFAVQYNFRPVSFVAIPPAGEFSGEPMFGQTKHAPVVLGRGKRLERDTVPVALPADAAPASVAEPQAATLADTTGVAAFPEVPLAEDVPANDVATPEPEAAVVPDAVAATSPPDAQTPPDTDTPQAEMPPVVQAEAAPPAAIPAADVPPTAIPASVLADSVPDVEEAPFAEVPESDVADRAEPDTSRDADIPPAPSTAALMAFASRRAAIGGADRSADPGTQTLPPRPLGAAPPRPGETTIPGLLADRMAARAAAASAKPDTRAPVGPMVTAPTMPGGKKQRKAMTGGAASPATPGIAASVASDIPRKPLTKPGGTFASSNPVRGKPRYLGLILTGILILFLALLAAWSSFFLASQTDPAATGQTDVAGIDAPDITDEALADGQDADAIVLDSPVIDAGPEPVADVVPDAVPDTAPETVPVAPVADIAAGPDPAATEPDTVIAATEPAGPAPETGVDTTGPAVVLPDAVADEILLSTADTPLAVQTAADLGAPELQGDAAPTAQMAPPPFGTIYEFNANGTIQAVADGIMTPDGVRLVAGTPASIPPARPAAIAAAATPAPEAVAPNAVATAPVDETTAVGADPALADARPRPRPAGLVVPASDDDAALQGDQPILASSLRPLARPATLVAAHDPALRESDAASLAAASAAAGSAAEAIIQDLATVDLATSGVTPSGSRLAVSVSRIPAPRPRDMERAVAAALEAATRAPEPEPEPEPEQVAAAAAPTPEAEPEPEVEAPVAAAPTSGSVADQATFVNALNLSRINLIGVYGTQSNRYALIRQANGRYKKVTVGDRMDGGTVAAITATEVRYQKGGRLIALQMPDT